MGRKAWWGATAGLALGLLAGAAHAADEDDVYRSSNPPTTLKKKADPKKADDKKSDDKKSDGKADARVKPAGAQAAAEPKPPDATQLLQEERQKFLRRQQVCDRLREVAQETGDKAMEQQADLLESRAWFIYQQRAGQLQLPGLGPMSTAAAAEKLTREPSAGKTGAQSAVRSIRAENNPPAGDRKE